MVTDSDGNPLVVDIDGTFASITIEGEDDIEVAIVSLEVSLCSKPILCALRRIRSQRG